VPRHLAFSVILLALGFMNSASADVIYNVVVNSSSIMGVAGSLDFNFNPGPLTTTPASLQIFNFVSDGSLTDCTANIQGFCATGDVIGQLSEIVTFDNGAGLNDYFDDFTFGSELSFSVRLYGTALSAQGGGATSGSLFALSIFSDTAGTTPVLTSDTADGFAMTIAINPDGSLTADNFSTETSLTSESVETSEPRDLSLLGILAITAKLFLIKREGRMSTLSLRK